MRTVVVGRLDRAGKGGVPKEAGDEALDDRTLQRGGQFREASVGGQGGGSAPVSPSTVAKPALRMASYSLSGSGRTARPKAPNGRHCEAEPKQSMASHCG